MKFMLANMNKIYITKNIGSPEKENEMKIRLRC